MTSTADLKSHVKAAYRLPAQERDSDQIAIWRVQLLNRGYEVVQGSRGGVSFQWVGHVPDGDPRWDALMQ